MKKINILLIMLLGLFLAACNPEDNDPNPNPNPTDYDDRSLVSDDCSHLDNIDDYQPVWCDEFDVDGLPDSTKWSYDVGGSGWGNNELQYYTDADIDNAFVEDGILTIKAINESFSGNQYTSARLITKYKGDWQYGKIQVRAKMPSGLGTWPAVWMLPTDWAYGNWPYSGEIDIMEHVGYEPTKIYGTLHSGAYNHSLGTQIGFEKTIPDAESEFHVYELEWKPAGMEMFIDGVRFAYFGYNDLLNIDIENSDAWPFDQRFHLIMNVAVGGNWGGVQGVDSNAFPTGMEVDYVRVYQMDYAGLDEETPNEVQDLGLLDATSSTIKVSWDHSTDDVQVKEYEIYADGVLQGTTTVNAYLVEDLEFETSYDITVVAVDFAGNRSEASSLTVSTEGISSIIGRIEAESYDNQQGVTRAEAEDVGGGEYVGWIDTNDYMEYTLYVPETGTYTISYRISSESVAGEIKLYGKSLVPMTVTSLPITGGWQTWQDVESSTFTLSEGQYTFKIKASIGGFNLNYFEFNKKVE